MTDAYTKYRCSGVTRSGARCIRLGDDHSDGLRYCYQHKPYEPLSEECVHNYERDDGKVGCALCGHIPDMEDPGWGNYFVTDEPTVLTPEEGKRLFEEGCEAQEGWVDHQRRAEWKET